jgi:putative DNA primase/helicase
MTKSIPQLPQAARAVMLSEDWLALSFIDKHCQLFRWTYGMDWMFHDGTRWVPDKQLMRRFTMARELCRDLAIEQSDDRTKAQISSAKTVANLLSLARSDQRIVVQSQKWDANIFSLNTPDGLVDLKTGEITPSNPRHLVTKLTSVAPKHGDCPRWMQFLDEIFPCERSPDPDDLIEFVQLLCGYMLTGSITEQKLFFFYGKGSNGKSVLLELLLWIMGDYGLKLTSGTLMQSKHSQHPTELAQLQGKRLAASSELEDGQYWAEARIKELTGDETLSARFMRADFFDFKQTQKHLIAGNYRPRLKGGDEAMQRRIVLIPFKAKFEGASRDDRLLEKLKTEGPQILTWMIRGAVMWAERGLSIPSEIKSESAHYMAEMDDIAQWVEDCCELHCDYEDVAGDLYRSFRKWKDSCNESAPAQRGWSERLLQQYPGISKKRKNKARYLSGIHLTYEEKARVQDQW